MNQNQNGCLHIIFNFSFHFHRKMIWHIKCISFSVSKWVWNLKEQLPLPKILLKGLKIMALFLWVMCFAIFLLLRVVVLNGVKSEVNTWYHKLKDFATINRKQHPLIFICWYWNMNITLVYSKYNFQCILSKYCIVLSQ